MTSDRPLEAAGVLHPAQPFLVLAIVVALGEEAVALHPARGVQHELVELHEAEREPGGLRLGEDADAGVDPVHVALVHELQLAGQRRITTGQFQK